MIGATLRRLLAVALVVFCSGTVRDGLLTAGVPPQQRVLAPARDPVIGLDVEYDDSFLAQYGDRVEDVVREIIAIHNMEWRRYRREWFELVALSFRPSGEERDASYLLSRFLYRTVASPRTIHVRVIGRQLEVYTNGRSAVPIGGLAYRGSDTVLVSAAPGCVPDLLAYYLFHELGHCWDALDIPFEGGDSTFGSKTRVTFAIDSGNEELMEDSDGPQPRDARGHAPFAIREKLAAARAIAVRSKVYWSLLDLLLHEPSPANPAYVVKKFRLLDDAGRDRAAIGAFLESYEITPRQLREDDAVRQQMAQHYWRAHDAIARQDYEAADIALEAMKTMSAVADVHMLVGAVERKVRKRR